ncbi:ArsR/SmtB family transcription factor [Rhizobium giardinii]|jgi:ArsR family transcriptional regulator|uniref:ArsR family transcriptional regulator n=1 Tax=Rhizobium giardinii TaxID=56731 RepID=A0A7W8U7K1_9HYPH|nr:metalloregulator ArsR/SmtB family transcription factor [Rhizobium giardinii]MBB5534208.1 ArsR family transcriptional regulator [Rhizobium giardinii]
MDKDEILKALAHPKRIEMLGWMKEPDAHFSSQHHPFEMGICASQFERCGLSQSTVSSHLSILQRAGLVTTQRVGQWIFYKRNEETIRAFLKDIGDTL